MREAKRRGRQQWANRLIRKPLLPQEWAARKGWGWWFRLTYIYYLSLVLVSPGVIAGRLCFHGLTLHPVLETPGASTGGPNQACAASGRKTPDHAASCRNKLNRVHIPTLHPVFAQGRRITSRTMGGLANHCQRLPTAANPRHIFWKKSFDGN